MKIIIRFWLNKVLLEWWQNFNLKYKKNQNLIKYTAMHVVCWNHDKYYLFKFYIFIIRHKFKLSIKML